MNYISFNRNSIYVLNNVKDKIIITNDKGQWIKMSKEVYNIFCEAELMKYTINDILTLCSEPEDKVFLKKLYDDLTDLDILKSKDAVSNDFIKVGIEITNKCNLQCKHCCFSAKSISDNDDSDLSTADFLVVIDNIISLEHVTAIQLSGGEPMTRKDFFYILSYLREKFNGTIILSTNGTLINNNNVKMITDMVDVVDMSIDGVNEESCSQIRGIGVFQKVINSIELLKKNGFENIDLSMIFSEKNEHMKTHFRGLCSNLEVNPIERIFSPVGRGIENVDLFKINKNEYYIPEEYGHEDISKITSRACGAAKNQFFIKNNANVYPCPSFVKEESKLGNLLEVKLDSIYRNKKIDIIKLLEEHKLYKKNSCNICDFESFCWTCPGEVFEINSMALFKDRCDKNKKILEKYLQGV